MNVKYQFLTHFFTNYVSSLFLIINFFWLWASHLWNILVFLSPYIKWGWYHKTSCYLGTIACFLLRRPKIELLWQMNNFSLWKKVVLSNQVVGQRQGRIRKLTLQLSANELHFWYNIKQTSRLVKVKKWIWGQLHQIRGGTRVFICRYKLYKHLCSSSIFSILSFGLKI